MTDLERDLRAFIDDALARHPEVLAVAARLPLRDRAYGDGVADGLHQAFVEMRVFLDLRALSDVSEQSR